jgi:hypothetical protein
MVNKKRNFGFILFLTLGVGLFLYFLSKFGKNGNFLREALSFMLEFNDFISFSPP